jgi:hypothetical protein
VAILLLVLASCAVMDVANGLETMGVAVGTHVAQLGHLLDGAATAVPVGVHVLAVWLVDCREVSDGGSELLDLGCHCSKFSILALVGLTHVGDGIVVGYGFACDFGNVVLNLIADVSHVVGVVVVVVPCHATATVLDVCVLGLDSCLKVVLGTCVVGLGGRGLLFPFHHLGLVENVEIVHLLQVELEHFLIQDGDVRLHKGGLVVVETLSNGGEVLVAVPLLEVGILELLLGLGVKGTPC